MAQTTLGQWSQRLLTLAGMSCLFYLFLVLIQPYRFPKVLAEKHGRVVDAQTGKGLPDVAVIVNYHLWSSTPMQAGDGGCMHQKIVWTDADGYYVIPNASKDIDVAEDMLLRMVPGYSRNYGWLLLYYKVGYVVKEDMERMADTIEGHPVPRAIPVEPYTKNGPIYIVPPVPMLRADMASSPVVADAYIASVRSLATASQCSLYEEKNSEASWLLRSDMERSVRKLICELPPNKILAKEARGGTSYDCALALGIKKVRERKGEGVPLTTGDLCESYKYVVQEDECSERPPPSNARNLSNTKARRSGERRNPAPSKRDESRWIPAFAGMTTFWVRRFVPRWSLKFRALPPQVPRLIIPPPRTPRPAQRSD